MAIDSVKYATDLERRGVEADPAVGTPSEGGEAGRRSTTGSRMIRRRHSIRGPCRVRLAATAEMTFRRGTRCSSTSWAWKKVTGRRLEGDPRPTARRRSGGRGAGAISQRWNYGQPVGQDDRRGGLAVTMRARKSRDARDTLRRRARSRPGGRRPGDPANIQDRDGAKLLLAGLANTFLRLQPHLGGRRLRRTAYPVGTKTSGATFALSSWRS